jgi:hypothetical protein
LAPLIAVDALRGLMLAGMRSVYGLRRDFGIMLVAGAMLAIVGAWLYPTCRDLTLVQVKAFRSGHSQAQRFTAEGLPLLSQEASQLHSGASPLEQ